VQPLEAKHKVAIALGLVVLGLMIWVSARSLTPAPLPAPSSRSASAGTGPHVDINMPDKVVTMLAVPEVILNPPSSSPDTSGAKEDKPSKPSRDTELKSVSAVKSNSNGPSPPVSTRKTSRRSDDTFLVKPE
jgi:hypothetical protein